MDTLHSTLEPDTLRWRRLAACIIAMMAIANLQYAWFPDGRGLAAGLTAGACGAGTALTVLPIQ